MEKKNVFILLCNVLLIVLLVGCGNLENTSSKKVNCRKIGITQIAEHAALNSARQGFIRALNDNNFKDGENISIDIQSAQNDMATTQTIADKFINDNDDLIFAISTPSAQAALNANRKAHSNIPVLITAITDPVQAKLVKSLDEPGENVTGTSDRVSINKQFNLIKQLVPRAKNIGIIYNTSEVNSELQVKDAEKSSNKFGFKIITSGVTSSNEISQALNSILDKVDVVYTITDNMVVAAMPTITQICYRKNKPVIGAESAHVKGGALATAGIDYYKLGYETGLKAVSILKGKKANQIPVTTINNTKIVINKDAAQKLKISIPKDILSNSEIIAGGVK